MCVCECGRDGGGIDAKASMYVEVRGLLTEVGSLFLS